MVAFNVWLVKDQNENKNGLRNTWLEWFLIVIFLGCSIGSVKRVGLGSSGPFQVRSLCLNYFSTHSV